VTPTRKKHISIGNSSEGRTAGGQGALPWIALLRRKWGGEGIFRDNFGCLIRQKKRLLEAIFRKVGTQKRRREGKTNKRKKLSARNNLAGHKH